MGKIIKMKKKKKNIWLPIILVIITAISGVLLAVNMNNPAVSGILNNGYTSEGIQLTSSRTYEFAKNGEGAVMCGAGNMMGIDAAGRQKWTVAFDTHSPIVSARGKFAVATERGGREFVLTASGDELLRLNTESSIIFAKVSKSGRVLVVTEERGYNAKVAVYAPDGKEIYVWHTSAYNVIDAAIADSGRAMSVAVLQNPDENGLSGVLTFDFNKEEGVFTPADDESLVMAIMYSGKNALAISDTSAFAVSPKGEKVYNISYEGKKLRNFGFDPDGSLALAFDEGTGGLVNIYSRSGKLTGTYKNSRQIMFMDTLGGNTLLNSDNGAVVINARGKEVSHVEFEKDVKSALLLSGRRKILGVSGDKVQVYTSR